MWGGGEPVRSWCAARTSPAQRRRGPADAELTPAQPSPPLRSISVCLSARRHPLLPEAASEYPSPARLLPAGRQALSSTRASPTCAYHRSSRAEQNRSSVDRDALSTARPSCASSRTEGAPSGDRRWQWRNSAASAQRGPWRIGSRRRASLASGWHLADRASSELARPPGLASTLPVSGISARWHHRSGSTLLWVALHIVARIWISMSSPHVCCLWNYLRLRVLGERRQQLWLINRNLDGEVGR